MTVRADHLALRLSAELARATAMAEQLEQTLEFSPSGERTVDVRTLQSLDLLTQTLADLTRFTAAVGPLLPAVPLLVSPALETLTLRAISDRLMGADEVMPPDRASGDLALF